MSTGTINLSSLPLMTTPTSGMQLVVLDSLGRPTGRVETQNVGANGGWVAYPANSEASGNLGDRAYNDKFIAVKTPEGWMRSRMFLWGDYDFPLQLGELYSLWRGSDLAVLHDNSDELAIWPDAQDEKHYMLPIFGTSPTRRAIVKTEGGPNDEPFLDAAGGRYGGMIDIPFTDATSMSVSCVAKIGSPAMVSTQGHPIFGVHLPGNSNGQLMFGSFYNTGYTNNRALSLFTDTTSAVANITGFSTAPTGWRNYTLVYEGLSTVRVYVNGVLMQTITHTWTTYKPNLLTALPPKSFSAGMALNSTVANGAESDAALAEISVFKTALTSGQIYQYYQYATGRYGNLSA